MSVIDEYVATLQGPEKALLAHMYDIVRKMVPDTTEELSYAMPAFKYKGKGLVAIMVNKNFLSIYPFAGVASLGLDLSAFEQTSGSIHFTLDKPISDEQLRQIVAARMEQVEAK